MGHHSPRRHKMRPHIQGPRLVHVFHGGFKQPTGKLHPRMGMQNIDLPMLRHGGVNRLGNIGVTGHIQPKPLRAPAQLRNLCCDLFCQPCIAVCHNDQCAFARQSYGSRAANA